MAVDRLGTALEEEEVIMVETVNLRRGNYIHDHAGMVTQGGLVRKGYRITVITPYGPDQFRVGGSRAAGQIAGRVHGHPRAQPFADLENVRVDQVMIV